jgi:hypothetical protein
MRQFLEAALLLVIVVIVPYFGIRLGGNVRGLNYGLGIYVGVSLMTLAIVVVEGQRFEKIWTLSRSGSYLCSIGSLNSEAVVLCSESSSEPNWMSRISLETLAGRSIFRLYSSSVSFSGGMHHRGCV